MWGQMGDPPPFSPVPSWTIFGLTQMDTATLSPLRRVDATTPPAADTPPASAPHAEPSSAPVSQHSPGVILRKLASLAPPEAGEENLDPNRLESLPLPILLAILARLPPLQRAAAACCSTRLCAASTHPDGAFRCLLHRDMCHAAHRQALRRSHPCVHTAWTHLDLGAFPGRCLTDALLMRCVGRAVDTATEVNKLCFLDVSGSHGLSLECLLAVVRTCPDLRRLTMLCAGPAPLDGISLQALCAARCECLRRHRGHLRDANVQPLRLVASFDVAASNAVVQAVHDCARPGAVLAVEGIDLSWRVGAHTSTSAPPHVAIPAEALDAALAASSVPLTLLDVAGAGRAAALAGGVHAHGYLCDALCRIVLRASSTLTSLSLAGCRLDARACTAVANALRHAPVLTTLSLAENHLGLLVSVSGDRAAVCADGIVCLGQALCTLRRLDCVNLRGCGLQPDMVAHLLAVMRPSVRSLGLSHNYLDHAAGAALAARATAGLTMLDVASTTAGAFGGAAALCAALAPGLSSEHCTLRALYLGSNGVDAATLAVLSGALAANASLTELDLASNCLAGRDGADATGFSALQASLTTNTSLLRLRLSGNAVSGPTCTQLAAAVGTLLQRNRDSGES